jgi:hypothetical protein
MSQKRRTRVRTFIAASSILASVMAAHAKDSICEAVAKYTTVETEDFPYALKRGEYIDAVTQYNVNKKTGMTSLCSHGGGCYPADALRLTNCIVDTSKPAYEDGDERSYGLILIRSKVPPTVLRQNDVELKLLELGMCNACADNAAAFYVKMPASRCANLVRPGLEGDPAAIEQLKETPDYRTE